VADRVSLGSCGGAFSGCANPSDSDFCVLAGLMRAAGFDVPVGWI
jgi:hypothetical protein